MRFSGSKSDYSLPVIELQTKLPTSDPVRAVQSGGSIAFHAQRSTNGTFARQISKPRLNQKLEEGLARARAAIRKASSSRRNLTSAVHGGDDVPTGMIYRNPAAFYQ
ncbi:hypothetical protein L1049_013661 [Liquidambar formosana]|uniref:Uncharacterized protein n=1 Tax=Liquidambar formosana TaxID=63359 RepID=A0AAP0RP85_LIQFO